MKQAIDWEEMMASAERSAKAAARQAERSIGGVAQVIETQRRHSSELAEIRKSLGALATTSPARPSPTATITALPARRPERSAWPFTWVVAVAFAAGFAFGAYFAS